MEFFDQIKHLSISKIDINFISKKINEEGYALCDNLIPLDLVEKIKSYWVKEFAKLLLKKPSNKSVRGNLHLGELDFNSYSNNEEWNIYRKFDFYWNKPDCYENRITREISIELHKIRNILEGNKLTKGLEYNEDGFGVYLSISHYPPSSGFLKNHADQHGKGKPKILQYMVNITHKNYDYFNGGLYLNKEKIKIDIDSMMKPGTVLFFDGNIEHGVIPVESNNLIGRIAYFAIPTFFITKSEIPQFIRNIEKLYLGIKRRM